VPIARIPAAIQRQAGLLDALAALTTSADKLIYATGANAVTQTTLTAYARSLLDDANAGTARTTLGAAASGAVTGTGITQATGKILGRTTASTGAIEEITVGTGLTLSAGSLSASITSGTAVATTSGTSIDFTSIPAGTKRITLMFSGVSTNGTSGLLVQIGDSGGVETTGYSSSSSTGSAGTSSTSGMMIYALYAAGTPSGTFVLARLNASTFTWVGSHAFGAPGTNVNIIGGGSKSLSAELDRIRLTTVNGTDVFDAGSVNILYE